MRRTAAFMTALGAVVLLDQATKALVASRMAVGQSIPVIGGLFSLTYIRNTGIAFGLFNRGAGTLKSVLLALVTLAALGFLAWLLREIRPGDLMGGLSVGLVAGGAVGNLIDRLRFGEVIDFLDVYWRTHHWPFFNVADSAITVGVILLILHQIFTEMRRGSA